MLPPNAEMLPDKLIEFLNGHDYWITAGLVSLLWKPAKILVEALSRSVENALKRRDQQAEKELKRQQQEADAELKIKEVLVDLALEKLEEGRDSSRDIKRTNGDGRRKE